jgi:phasin family protein
MKKTYTSKAAAKPFEEAVQAGKQTFDAFVKAGNEAAAKGYEQAVQMTQEQVAKANSAFIKGCEDIQGFGKENVEAFVQASTIFAKGAEQISKQVMALTQSSMQSSVSTAKALMGCKTLRDVIDLQADFARSNFDSLVAEGTKLSEMSFKVTNDAIAPIQARVNLAVEKLTKPIAA